MWWWQKFQWQLYINVTLSELCFQVTISLWENVKMLKRSKVAQVDSPGILASNFFIK